MEQRSRYSVRQSVTQSRAEHIRAQHSTAHLTHLSAKSSPSVTHTRVQPFAGMLGNRARFALLSEVTA